MIKIKKPQQIPDRLTNLGSAANQQNCLNYDARSKSYIGGEKKFEIDPKIYGHASVKKALKDAQHNKCCFCEKGQIDEFGAVEHFRPKNGYHSSYSEPLLKPGYYWCAYTWTNLFFVCGACNSSYKRNLFPLSNEAKRAKSHHDTLDDEDPLILDPSGRKNSRNHILFDGPFIKGKTKYGKNTIEICGLDRVPLNDLRQRLIDDINARLVIVFEARKFKKDQVREAKAYLMKAQSPLGEFSAAATDYISQFDIELD